MQYNDYQILSDSQYKMIKQVYSASQNNEQALLNRLFLNFEQCKRCCFGLSNKVNKKVLTAIENAKQEYDKLINNINLIFKIDAKTPTAAIGFNIFSFTKKVVDGLKIVQQLCCFDNDKKLFNFALNSSKTILNVLDNILSSLENSNIYTFKYM